MATTGYNKKGRPTWDLSADEEKRFNKMQAERIINDESVIRSLFDDTQRKQKSITDALSVDGWTDSKSRVNLQKDIYSYQNNLAKLKSYGYDTTYQSEFGKTADKIAGARSQYYSNFKTKGDYDNYEIGERLKKNLKGATYEDIQNQIADTQDTINRLRHNGKNSKLLTENARKLNILENWTNYESVNDFEKALKNVENLQNTASSEFAGANIDLQTAAGDEEYKKYSRESDAATNWMNNLNEFQAKLTKGKEDLEFSNKAQEYAKRLSGDEVRAIREYNNLYDKGVNNTLSLVAQGISSGGTSDNGAVDNGLTIEENNRKIEIENYFKNRGIDLKTVSDIYRSEDNKKLQEINLEKIKSDMDSSKLATAIYTLSNPLVSATGGIPAVVGNIIYGDDVKYNPYNLINKASAVITQGFNDSVDEYLLKNKNLTLAPGMLNKKGEFLKSLIGGAYDLYNTMAESAIMRIPAAVTGMPFLTDALFGLNAFASTYNDMIDSGADKGKALATSALAGVFEGLFEHVSLEKLKGFQTSASVTAKDFLKNSLKQFVTEGSEELFTDFANTISDQLINGDASELNRRMQDLVASGSTYNEALTQVAKEYAAQEVDTFVIGGLSGAVSGAGYTGLAAINNAETGRNINRSGQRSALLSDAGQLADTSYDSALRAAYESVSRDEEKSRKGLGANLRTGNLYNLSRNQAYENAVDAQKENVKKSVNNVLVSIGTDERKADILSDSLAKIATGEKLTKTEKQLVNALRNTADVITNLNEDGKKAYGEIVSGNIDEMTADGIASRLVKSAGLGVKQAQSLAENIKSGNDRLALNFEYVAEMYNAGTAVDEASKAKSEKAYDTLERLDKYALGMSAKSAVVARSDEKNAKPAEIKKITNIDKHNGVMTVELSDGKDAQVSLTEENNGDIEFSNKKDAYIYTAAGTLFNTTEDANSFILASKNTDLPATDFVHEFEAVVDNAKAGEKIGNTKLPNEIAEIAYDIGLNSGKDAYRTFESGTSIKGNKDMSKLDVNNLNYGVTNMSTTRGGQSKTDMDVISRTLDAYGRKNNIKYVFVDSIKSPNGKNASGTYSAEDNVVYLSVNSKNPLSVAAGHETFHFMKRNNSKAGRELQEYIINKLKADKSYDYNARVKELSELHGTDDADAINEEIAANSMFDIFDEATVKDLAKNHKKLFDIVKEKLGEVLEYFKNAVKKYADFLGNKEARSNLKNDYEALQSIRDRMDKALEEIKNGESEKTKSDEDKKEKEKKFAEKFSLDENEDVVNKYNQILTENKHLRELNTILREEMHKSPSDRVGSKGKRIINDVVEHIIKKYKSSADSGAVSEQVLEVLNYAKEKNIDIDSVTQAVASAVKKVAEKSSLVIDDDGLEPLRKELKAYLRETPIRLTDETKEFLAEEYGSYEKFRRKYLSRIRLTNDIDAPTLDTLWSEITERFNGIFYSEDAQEDSLHQPLVLAAALEQDGKLYLSDAGKTDMQGFAVDMATEIIKDYVAESATMRDKWEISKKTAIRNSETALKREKQILKEEVTRTSRHVTNKGAQALDEIAKNIVKEHGIGYGVMDDTEAKRLSAELLRVYERNDNDPSVAELIDVAKRIINKSEKEIDYKDGTYWERQRLRNYIKTHPITLSDELEKEYILMDNNATILSPVIADEYSYFEPFSENGTDFVDAYKYLSVEFPSLFDRKHVKSESNMLGDFRQAFYGDPGLIPESMKMREMAGGDIDDNAYKLALEMKAEYAKKSMTFADRVEKRHQKELRSRLDRLYEQKRKEQTAIRAMYERKIQREREQLGAMIEQQKDIRYDLEQRRYFRAQARKNVRAMSEKLLNPTKNKFIPAELRAPVAEFLKEFTYDALMFKSDDLDSLQRRYDAVIANNVRTAFSIDDAYITDAIAQIRDLTAKLNETFGNNKRNFRKIGWSEMKAINEFVKALSHLVNNYNTVTIGGRHVDMYQTAYEMTKDLPKSRKQIASFSKLSDTYDQIIKYGNMTPYYFFKRMGGTLETLYKDLYDGEMSAAKEGLSAKQKLEGIYKAYNAEDWINNKTRRDYTTERGDKFQLTTDQRLYLYAAVRTMIEDQRMQENGEVSPIAKYDVEIPHIMQGGIVFRDDVRKERKQVGDKLKIKATFEYKDSTPIRLTESDISAIFDDMPNEQKKFVDEIVKYMSGDLAKLGNETSVRLYGYEKFTKGYYFPIRSAQYYVRRADNSEQGQERSTSPLIKNKGMTKERKESANNPVVVENFTDVMSSHITDMINFRYLAEPQFNMFRVMNYNAKAIEPVPAESEAQDEKTDFAAFENPREAVNVRTSLDNAYGHETTRYIDNLIHDISSGATLDEIESVTAKALTGFKKLATAANLSVVVQQPTAIMRAMALVDPKYFVNKISWNKSYNEAMKYAGTAILKDIGGFDMGNNRSMASWLTDFDTGVKDKIKAFSPVEVTKDDKGEKNVRMSWNDEKNKSTRDDVFSYGAEKADAVTWGLIWEAVKNETRAKSNLTGEALLEEAGKRFDEVIEATQVYDSVLSRSQFMRAKSTIGKTVTAFMAEPTKTFNMLMDANYERWVKKSKGSFKYLGRATGAILASNLLNAFIRSLVTALRRDPDKSYLEQYTKEVIENFADGISIINMLPIIKDIVSVMQGEDLTRSDFEPLADMYDAVTGAFKSNADVWDKANGVLVPAGVLTGIPLRNISRDLKALLNVFNYADKKTTSAGLKFAVNEALNNIISKKTLNIFDGAFANDDYDKLFKYYDRGDTTRAEQKYDEMKAYLMWSGKTEDKAENAIENKIKSHILEKYPEIVEAVSAHVNGNVGVYTDKMKSVSEKYDAELVKAVEKSVESKLKRASTAKADNDTDSFNKLIDELTGYGYDKDTLERDIDKVKSSSSSSSDGYNGIYNKADAVRAYVSGDMTLYNQIKDEMKLDESKIKTALNELYSAGEVTDEQYTDMYIAVLAPGKTTKTVTDVNEAKKNEAFFALEAQQAKKDGEEYSKYADINTAMEDFVSGKKAGLKVFNAEVKKLEEHGVDKSTIKGNITTQYKNKVRELYKTNRSEYVNLRAKIVAMCGQLGYSTEESVKYLDNWVKDLK
mgnify:CR=1 FL=1